MNSNMEKMIEAASKKLGTSPDSLKSALNSGNTEEILSRLSDSDKEKLNALLKNPALREKLMKSPEAEKIIRMMKK